MLVTVAITSTRDPIFVTVTRTLPRPRTRNDPTVSLRIVSSLRLPSAALHVLGVITFVVGVAVGTTTDDDGIRVADAVAVVVVDGEYVGVDDCDAPTARFDPDVDGDGMGDIEPDINGDAEAVPPTDTDDEADIDTVGDTDGVESTAPKLADAVAVAVSVAVVDTVGVADAVAVIVVDTVGDVDAVGVMVAVVVLVAVHVGVDVPDGVSDTVGEAEGVIVGEMDTVGETDEVVDVDGDCDGVTEMVGVLLGEVDAVGVAVVVAVVVWAWRGVGKRAVTRRRSSTRWVAREGKDHIEWELGDAIGQR